MNKMNNWAENECRIACKRENPDYDFNSNEFDYGCGCYKSALKAYNSLLEDGHSGMSWGFTKNILIRLIEGKPLTAITDDDFPKVEYYDPEDEWLKIRQLKSSVQCPRMSSLFREETLDGKVKYYDVDRAYYVNVDNTDDTFYSNMDFLDDLIPITMPYYPPVRPYKIYTRSFLFDKNNGDFDTKGILYMITPDGEKIDLNIYKAEKDNKFVDITEAEYNYRYEHRVK